VEKLRISAGDSVEILPLKRKGISAPYITRVEDFDEANNTILIYSPISHGSYVVLPKKEKYLVKFVNKRGIYRAAALISKYVSEGGIHFIELKLLGNVQRIQHRNFYRLPYSKSLRFQIWTENESGIWFSGETYNGIIQDLSAGGMKMTTKTDIDANGIIIFDLEIDKTNYSLCGSITFKKHNPHALQPYTYGVKFFGMSNADKEALLLSLHHLQLESL
jgi:c-di-GMP-binding flagellar brake protein YcgR